MPWLVIGALAFIAFVVFRYSSSGRSGAAAAKAVRPLAGVLVGALALLALAREQILPALVLAACALVVTGAHKKLLARLRLLTPSPDAERLVDISLDPVSGTLDGVVRAGTFAGQRLSNLSLDQLIALQAECVARDPRSARQLESYLQRRFGGARQSSSRASHGSATMSRSEALAILGLKDGASEAEIKAAYHRLMLKLHPDQGGSTYLATQLNRAKAALLG